MMVCFFILASIGVAICAGDQAAKYLASQDKKQLFLTEVREDISVLSSCLQTHYRTSGTKPEFTIPPEDVSKIISSSKSTEKK